MCPNSFTSQCQRQDSNPSLSKTPGLFPPHSPGSFSNSDWELESKRKMRSDGRKRAQENESCSLASASTLALDLALRFSWALSTLCFCSCSPCSELTPGDPILLSFWTLSSLQNSWNSVLFIKMGFSGGSNGKESTYNAGDPGLIPGSGRSRGKGNGYPCRSSCLEKSHRQRSLETDCRWGHTESAWNGPMCWLLRRQRT